MTLNTLVTQGIFYLFATLTIFSAMMVVAMRNPVRSALFLVLTFISCAGLWLLLEAEFLALLLIFVYVGAVMTLFLFVVMMLRIDPQALRVSRWLPGGLLVVAVTMGLMLMVVNQYHFNSPVNALSKTHTSNTLAIGKLLYTEYAYPLQLAGLLLLSTMIAAVALTHRGAQQRKEQRVSAQLARDPKEQVRLISLPSHNDWNKE